MGKFGKVAILILVIVMAFSSIAVAKQKVVLRVVTRTWAKELIAYATKKLQENHPDLDIVVDAKYYEYQDTRTQLAMRLARREPIDVMTVDHIWLGQFKDLMMPIPTSKVPHYEDWIPAFRKLMEKYAPKGYTLGLYGSTDVRMIFWNKEYMRKVGIDKVYIKTWEDVKAYAQIIKANLDKLPKDVDPVGFMAGNTEHTNSRWYDYLWAAGGDILTPDEKKAMFNKEAGIRALEFYGWFLKNGMTKPEDVLSPKNGEVYDQAFLNGKFVISLGNGHWLGDTTARNVGMTHEEFSKKFGAALIPAPASGGERGATVAGGYVWGVSKFSKHPDLAIEFIYYITGPDDWNVEGTGKYGIPTVKSALDTISKLPYADIIKQALEHAKFRPTIPDYPKIAEVIRDAIQKYVMNYKTKSAKEILDEAASEVNDILSNK